MINLLYKDHILAHYYLAQCTSGSLRRAMLNAFKMLVNFDSEFDISTLDNYQKLYEECYKLRLGQSPGNKGVPMKQEQKDKISKSLMGHSVSEESRMKMRLAQLNMSPEKRKNIIEGNKNKNYRATPETRAKISASNKGKTMSEESKRKTGFANSIKLTGGRWFNDGVSNIYVRPGESARPEWIHGKLKSDRKWVNNGVTEFCMNTCPEGFVPGRLPRK